MCWAEKLENHGFQRKIAGDADFNAAVNACAAMANCHRGLIIAGEYGVGKTRLATALNSALWHGYAVRINLGDQHALEMFDERWMDYHACNLFARNILLDDLGAEKTVNEYGIRIESVGDFIVRYHLRGEGRLIITTNLSTTEIDSRYGGRVLSRLKDLCIPLHLIGKDKRQWQKGIKP